LHQRHHLARGGFDLAKLRVQRRKCVTLGLDLTRQLLVIAAHRRLFLEQGAVVRHRLTGFFVQLVDPILAFCSRVLRRHLGVDGLLEQRPAALRGNARGHTHYEHENAAACGALTNDNHSHLHSASVPNCTAMR